jgi:hypothetical protein
MIPSPPGCPENVAIATSDGNPYANVSTQSRSRSGADHGALAGAAGAPSCRRAIEARGEQAGTHALCMRT